MGDSVKIGAGRIYAAGVRGFRKYKEEENEKKYEY